MREKQETKSNPSVGRADSRYDRLYKRVLPLSVPPSIDISVEEALGHVTSGILLDLGSGLGRHSLFAARRGFRVVAVDVSRVAIKSLQDRASASKMRVSAAVQDVRAAVPTTPIDVVVATFVLHHLKREEAVELIQRCKTAVRPGGAHALAVFTPEGTFAKRAERSNRFFPTQEELRELYSDWSVVHYSEVVGQALTVESDGRPIFNTTARLVALHTTD